MFIASVEDNSPALENRKRRGLVSKKTDTAPIRHENRLRNYLILSAGKGS